MDFPDEIVEKRTLSHFLESGSRGIFGAPKSGKSSLMSALFEFEESTVILDTQNGYRDLGGRVWNLLDIAKKKAITPLNALRLAFGQIIEADKYKIIVLDTITDVESWAKKEIIEGAFKNNSVGRSLNEGKALGYGVGFDKAADLFMTIIRAFWALTPTTFSVGHMEYQAGTSENYFRGLQLTLKQPKVDIPTLLDHIGMTTLGQDGLYRLSFAGFDVVGDGGQLQKISGSRHKQLQGQEFVLPEEDPWKEVREAYEQ